MPYIRLLSEEERRLKEMKTLYVIATPIYNDEYDAEIEIIFSTYDKDEANEVYSNLPDYLHDYKLCEFCERPKDTLAYVYNVTLAEAYYRTDKLHSDPLIECSEVIHKDKSCRYNLSITYAKILGVSRVYAIKNLVAGSLNEAMNKVKHILEIDTISGDQS